MNFVSLAMKLRGGLIYAPRLERITKHPDETQEKFLHDLIAANVNTVFGHDHHFDQIRTIDDFRRQVPIQGYADVKPYIERMKAGEKNVLTAEDPEIFALTSGSTGEPKFVPITKSFIDQYSSIATAWMYYILRDHPAAYAKRIFSPQPPPTDDKTAGGTPIGTISGYIQQHLPSFVRARYVLFPEYNRGVTEYEDLYYLWMRLGIEADVSMVILVNPATHILLARRGDEWRDEIIADIEKGTLSHRVGMPAETRALVESTLKPNPARATELRQIIQRTGHLYPKDYWPNHAVSVCWKSSSMSTFLPQLPEYYGEIPVRDLGLSATEVRVCTPVQDEGAHGILNIDGGFFEFIPEEKIGTEHPKTLLANELSVDQNYAIVVTPLNGLYRYNLNDVVRVVGFYNRTLLVEFVHKGQGYSSLTGEKLSEWQVLKAVNDTARELDFPIEMFLAHGDAHSEPRYQFYVGFQDRLQTEQQNYFIDTVDRKLSELNMEYENRRHTGRLGPCALRMIDGKKVQEAYHTLKLSQGFHDTQMKFPVLITDYNQRDFAALQAQGVLG
jgi:hypothetical protein